MRRLTWLTLILAVTWCAWWAVASVSLQQSIAAWFEDRRSIGWQAQVAEMSKHGFPLRLHTRLKAVSVNDPSTGVSVKAPQLDLIAAAYWPGFMTVQLPNAPLTITTHAGPVVLQAQDAEAALRLHSGATLQLQSLSLVSDAWTVSTSQGKLLSADDLHLSFTQDETSTVTYQIDLRATDLKPGIPIRTILALPIDWPLTFEVFSADLSVAFDRPWDRTALAEKRPQPRTIAVRSINATWGTFRVAGSGDLAIDPSGVPNGNLSVTIANWRDIMDIAEASGALPATQRVQIEFIANALSNLDGDPNNLILTLSFQNGQMLLGPINLGPTPRLILR